MVVTATRADNTKARLKYSHTTWGKVQDIRTVELFGQPELACARMLQVCMTKQFAYLRLGMLPARRRTFRANSPQAGQFEHPASQESQAPTAPCHRLIPESRRCAPLLPVRVVAGDQSQFINHDQMPETHRLFVGTPLLLLHGNVNPASGNTSIGGGNHRKRIGVQK